MPARKANLACYLAEGVLVGTVGCHDFHVFAPSRVGRSPSTETPASFRSTTLALMVHSSSSPPRTPRPGSQDIKSKSRVSSRSRLLPFVPRGEPMRTLLISIIISVFLIAVLNSAPLLPVAIAQELPNSAPPKVVFIADKEASLTIADFEESYELYNEEIKNRNDLREQGITRIPSLSGTGWAERILGIGTGNQVTDQKLTYRIEPLSDRPVEFSQFERPDLIEEERCFIFQMGRMTFRTQGHYKGNTITGPKTRIVLTSFAARQPYSVYWRESRRDAPVRLIQGQFEFEGSNGFEERKKIGEFDDNQRKFIKSTLPIDEYVRMFCRSSMLGVSINTLQPEKVIQPGEKASIALGLKPRFLEVVSGDLANAFLVGTKRRHLRLDQRDGRNVVISELQNPLPCKVRLVFGIFVSIEERTTINSRNIVFSRGFNSYRVVDLGPKERKIQEFEDDNPGGGADLENSIVRAPRVLGAYLIWNSDPDAAKRRPHGFQGSSPTGPTGPCVDHPPLPRAPQGPLPGPFPDRPSDTPGCSTLRAKRCQGEKVSQAWRWFSSNSTTSHSWPRKVWRTG